MIRHLDPGADYRAILQTLDRMAGRHLCWRVKGYANDNHRGRAA